MTDSQRSNHTAELAEIASMLAQGLETTTEPFPKTNLEFSEIQNALRALDKTDLRGKLIVAGFLDHPYGRDQMRCRECTYYLINRKWCDLPEIALPVEPDWWCRLWRI